MTSYKVDIGAQRSDHQRLVEMPRQQCGGHAVWIVIVGVDHIKVKTLVQQTLYSGRRPHRQGKRRNVHANLRWQEVAWMLHINPTVGLASWGAGHAGVIAKARMSGEKPRYWCHNLGLNLTATQQFTQTSFHKYSVTRSDTAWIQAREQKGASFSSH